MTVLENLKVGAFQRTDKENFQEDLDRVYTLFPRLHERMTQKAGTLSGGEQQMVAMGRALMARPKLLMLDEPSMGLAPIFVERIFDIVKTINEQGTAILLVEQNALMALDVAQRGYSCRLVRSSCRATPRNSAPTTRSASATSARNSRPQRVESDPNARHDVSRRVTCLGSLASPVARSRVSAPAAAA